MKRLVRLSEGDLHRIVKESVNKVLYNEGIGDRFRGAISGFRNGRDSMMQNDEDASSLWQWVGFAQNVLKSNNPNDYKAFIERFVNAYSKDKSSQQSNYGFTNYNR